MVTIIGISGSTRRGSFNSSLLRALAAATPREAELRIESIAAEPVARLKDAIAAAQSLLLVTPEYNNSVPGVAKNAIDWCSRPPADVPRVFRDKPVAIAGASPGGFGTVLSQNAWLPVFRTLGANLYPGKLLVSRAGNVFDANGNITDAAVRDSLPKFMARFIAFIGG